MATFTGGTADGLHTAGLEPSDAKEDDFEALRHAALEKLDPHLRSKTAILPGPDAQGFTTVDLHKMTPEHYRILVQHALRTKDQDTEHFLRKVKQRMDRVGILPSTVEVHFEKLRVDAQVFVGSRGMPTVLNAYRNTVENWLQKLGLIRDKRRDLVVLDDVSGVLRPGRLTLLLGPPASGKTTLLKALAGKLVTDSSLKMEGAITYNGEPFDNFYAARTAAYVDQVDCHIGEQTVRETFDFAARVQGVGHKLEELQELRRREKEAGIKPDWEIDAFLKAEARQGKRTNIVSEYIIRLLGLEVCSDTLVGNEMMRGVSGGQKKRVTTGEMIVGPKKTLFMDEISTGLDSSTTYQIVKCLRNFVHMRDATVLLALLQPPPETYNLFDDIMLLSEGKVVYHGPREQVMEFFESLGFCCPERKGIADFLQEVTSRKDQRQYWAEPKGKHYMPVVDMAEAFEASPQGRAQAMQRATPFDKSAHEKDALVRTKYALSPRAVFKAMMRREWILMKRNAFLYAFRFFQIVFIGTLVATLFIKPRMTTSTVAGGNLYLAVIFYGLLLVLFDGMTEMILTIERLPVYYKQSENLFFPGWAYVLPTTLLRIPYSLVQATLFCLIVYWSVGLAPGADRWWILWLCLVLLHQVGVAMFRFVGAAARNDVAANTGGSFLFLLFIVLGGFVLAKENIPKWWKWAYWCSPLTYVQIASAVNEFSHPRWQQLQPNGDTTIGNAILQQRGLPTERKWIGIGIAALIGFAILFNLLTALFHSLLGSLSKPQMMLTEENLREREIAKCGMKALGGGAGADAVVLDMAMGADGGAGAPAGGVPASARKLALALTGSQKLLQVSAKRMTSDDAEKGAAVGANGAAAGPLKVVSRRSLDAGGQPEVIERGMVLPFTQLPLTFHDMHYYVDLPKEMESTDPEKLGPKVSTPPGAAKPMLELLCGVSGAFRPGVLTALVGVSGAGKTTLMDVLAGRKTGGIITGDIRVNGHPKVQQTFARVTGYVEQTDIHVPQTTVHEALLFSCRMRFAQDIGNEVVAAFVSEVMELVELQPIRDALVGTLGVDGLSVEQRKRLTIAVELVANPSIVFMDEPTSGLDARAAAIVMRTVRNTVNTGRTVVCTIHQPSIDIFEAFDELLLMKRGGYVIYFGPLGRRSIYLVDYFEAIPGVEPLVEGINPATWMLESSTPGHEQALGVDFAQIYVGSALYARNEALIAELSVPPAGSEPLRFDTVFPQSQGMQFLLVLRRNFRTYWRSPVYNATRFFSTVVIALMLGSIFWNIGQKTYNVQNISNVLGGMYIAVLFIGVINAITVQPVIGIQRPVFFRERAAGMFGVLPYIMAGGLVEIPYNLLQVTLYTLITYFMIGFQHSASKFCWYWLTHFATLVCFTFYGIMSVYLTPSVPVANVLSSTFYGLWNLFSGFIIPKSAMPGWWSWFYYLDPVSWTLYGIIVTQFGDYTDRDILLTDNTSVSVTKYLDDQYGYKYSFRGYTVLILFGFAAFFALIGAAALKVLNFQRR